MASYLAHLFLIGDDNDLIYKSLSLSRKLLEPVQRVEDLLNASEDGT